VLQGLYSVSANPVDGTIWSVVLGFPERRSASIQDQAHRDVRDSLNDSKNPDSGFSPRGADLTPTACSGRCLRAVISRASSPAVQGPLNGPAAATGKACPEGWKLYTIPGPQFKGVAMKGGSAESPYYDWSISSTRLASARMFRSPQQPIDAMFALVDGKWVIMRVPYPMGFFSKAWTGGSMIPRAAGKAKAFTRPMPAARAPISRAAKGRHSRCRSASGRQAQSGKHPSKS